MLVTRLLRGVSLGIKRYPNRPGVITAHRSPRSDNVLSLPRVYATAAAIERDSGHEVEESNVERNIDKNLQINDEGLPSNGNGILLRPYQVDAIEACSEALQGGFTRIGVSSPTGSGKTTMFMNLIPLITGRGRSRGQTLIIVSSVELATQAENAAKRLLGPEWSVEVEQGRRVASGHADVTIATYQTLNNIERLTKFKPEKFKLVIVDEAHHAAALSYLRLLHYFNDEVQLPSAMSPISKNKHGMKVPIVGFSATFSRPDQLALSAVFEKIVFHREITSMLDDGWLAPAKSVSVKCDLDLAAVEMNQSGDFNTTSLAKHVNTKQINDLIVRAYLHRARDRRSTLIFCVDLSHVAALTEAFRKSGLDARSISSMSQPSVRKETIAAFSRGDFPVLINCEVLTEGTDIPEIDCIILARPTQSKNLLAQMVGRGLRLSPATGKEDCLLIDIVDNVSRANGMLVSPTLFGLSHDEIEADERERSESSDISTTDGSNSDMVSSDPVVRKVTFIDLEDPFRLGRKGKPIAMMSENAWVSCGASRYVLELLGNGYIMVEPSENSLLSITYRRKLPMGLNSKAFFSRVQHVASAEDLERAIQTADKYALRVVGRQLASQLSRYAAWRARPPSKAALELLAKAKGVELDTRDGNQEQEVVIMGKRTPISKITAGQVASYICAANHGAATLKRKEDRAIARAEEKAQQKAQKAADLAARNLPLPVDQR